MLDGSQGRAVRLGAEVCSRVSVQTGLCQLTHNAAARFKKGARLAVRNSSCCGHWIVKQPRVTLGAVVLNPSLENRIGHVLAYMHIGFILILSCTLAVCFALYSATARFLFFFYEGCFVQHRFIN
jgi:hypothetical protein